MQCRNIVTKNVMDDHKLFDGYWTLVRRFALWPSSKASLMFRLARFFEGVTFDGKSMLDIGGGTGWISLFGACMGAKSVVCLEPEVDGSRKGALNKLREVCANLPHHLRIIPKAVRFQEFDPGNETFDIVVSHGSINHLDEEACINLQHSADARATYSAIFQKLSELTATSGKLIIVDCS